MLDLQKNNMEASKDAATNDVELPEAVATHDVDVPESATNHIKFSVFTSFDKNAAMTKRISRDSEGRIVKDAKGCRMYSGEVTLVEITPQYFSERLLERRKMTKCCIGHGICDYSSANVVAKKELESTSSKKKPCVARTKDFFHYPVDGGLGMLDYDKAKDNAVASEDKALEVFKPKQLMELVSSICPTASGASYVWMHSASACIYDASTGEELRGPGSGFHLYLFPKHASDWPRFLSVLGQRMILAGYGRIELSRAGSMLVRTLVDLAVASPERLDFISNAVCEPGLEQKLPPPQYMPGNMLDTEQMKSLSEEEEHAYDQIVDKLKDKAKSAAEAVKEAYVEEESVKLHKSSNGNMSLEQARNAVASRQEHVLCDDDLLFFDKLKGKAVSVGEVFADPTEYDGQSCADPLEPEYDGGSRTKAKFYWRNGRPTINSFAHGQSVYSFLRFKNSNKSNKNKSNKIKWNLDSTEQYFRKNVGKLVEMTSSDKLELALEIMTSNDFNELQFDFVEKILQKNLGCSRASLRRVRETTNTKMAATRQTQKAAKGGKKGEGEGGEGEKEDQSTHWQLAEAVALKHADNVVGSDGKFWMYNEKKGLFCELARKEIEHQAALMPGKNCKKLSDYKSICEIVYKKLEDQDFFANAPLGLPAASSFIRVSDDGSCLVSELLSPSHRMRWKLDVEPVVETPAPLLERYLGDTFSDDDLHQIKLLQEVLGAIVIGAFPSMQKAVLLKGDGCNGKSVLLEIISSIFPPDKIASIRPDDLEKDYNRAALAGKMINIVGELNKDAALQSSFKDFVGCDTRISARNLYESPFSFVPRVVHVFASNHFPHTQDYSDGFFRRWVIFDFRNVVPPERRIQNLGKKIATEEQAQFVGWCLQGAVRFLASGRSLTKSASHDQCLHEWKQVKDSVHSFLHDEEYVVFDSTQRIGKRELFDAYRTYCMDTGRRTSGYQEFLSRMKRIAREFKEPGGKRCFVGIRLVYS